VVLSVVDDLVPLLKPEQVLVDLAKGLADGDRLISDVIEEKLKAGGKHNVLCVMMGPTSHLNSRKGSIRRLWLPVGIARRRSVLRRS